YRFSTSVHADATNLRKILHTHNYFNLFYVQSAISLKKKALERIFTPSIAQWRTRKARMPHKEKHTNP
ncbi:MAG: hypothetical protein K2K05_00775, partial [Muribaculaceae bacterium]|nr:hypothetical protein [Muribaculaceae bacterium]